MIYAAVLGRVSDGALTGISAAQIHVWGLHIVELGRGILGLITRFTLPNIVRCFCSFAGRCLSFPPHMSLVSIGDRYYSSDSG